MIAEYFLWVSENLYIFAALLVGGFLLGQR